MGSEQDRFPQQERCKRWGACWGALPCFGAQKGGKRIVPASRIPEPNTSAAQTNGQAIGLPGQATSSGPSLLAPPSSPASFSNSALASTAQSPSCFLSLSANSPGGPSNAMYATGPYAHETQLVSPPVFSTFTTEPSTAPFTPPPELAHLTTPSSPDVPFAKFLSSSADLKGSNRTNYVSANDLHATYSLYPGSPDTPGATMLAQDTNFFCPDTFARYYLDHDPPFPHGTGRLSVSKDSDVYNGSSGNGHQNRVQNRSSKQDVEELEAYRASFGFSADEIVSTSQYVEISDVMDDSFSMTPVTSSKQAAVEHIEASISTEGLKAQKTRSLPRQRSVRSEANLSGNGHFNIQASCNPPEDHNSKKQPDNVSGSTTPGNDDLTDEEDIFSKMGSSKANRKYPMGMSSSDAEIDYRRGRSSRKGKGDFAWYN